jgi:ABC-2 type transport system ATP-binding protein
MASGAAVETQSLVKRFGAVTALDGVDLTVPAGAFFGLLGPNGAGKTTAVSILCTLLRPSSGEARVFGLDVVRQPDAVRRQIGIVFQEASLDDELTGRESLDLYARLYHLDDRARRVEQALGQMALGTDADRPLRQLSGGMRRRLEVARGLLHEPRLLFLDEPTLGLDVPSRRALWQRLAELRARRTTTCVLTTHYMEEAARLCDQVAILDRGRIAARGTPEELCRAVGGDRVELEMARPGEAFAAVRAVPGVRKASLDGGRIALVLEDAPTALASLVQTARHFGIRSVRMREVNLEDAFLHFTGRGPEDEGALE